MFNPSFNYLYLFSSFILSHLQSSLAAAQAPGCNIKDISDAFPIATNESIRYFSVNGCCGMEHYGISLFNFPGTSNFGSTHTSGLDANNRTHIKITGTYTSNGQEMNSEFEIAPGFSDLQQHAYCIGVDSEHLVCDFMANINGWHLYITKTSINGTAVLPPKSLCDDTGAKWDINPFAMLNKNNTVLHCFESQIQSEGQIYCRALTTNNEFISDKFRLTDGNNQNAHRLAKGVTLANDNFLVAFQSHLNVLSSLSSTYQIKIMIINGVTFDILQTQVIAHDDSSDTRKMLFPHIAEFLNGNILLAWFQPINQSTRYDIDAKILSPDLQVPVTDKFLVKANMSSEFSVPVVSSTPDGNIAITYHAENKIKMNTYNSQGQSLCDDVIVSSATEWNMRDPKLIQVNNRLLSCYSEKAVGSNPHNANCHSLSFFANLPPAAPSTTTSVMTPSASESASSSINSASASPSRLSSSSFITTGLSASNRSQSSEESNIQPSSISNKSPSTHINNKDKSSTLQSEKSRDRNDTLILAISTVSGIVLVAFIVTAATLYAYIKTREKDKNSQVSPTPQPSNQSLATPRQMESASGADTDSNPGMADSTESLESTSNDHDEYTNHSHSEASTTYSM